VTDIKMKEWRMKKIENIVCKEKQISAREERTKE
jgi:hypothetical protein